SAGSERGLARLAAGGLTVGMAYDRYAQALWGLTDAAGARDELAATRAAGLGTASGGRQYDWQQTRAAGRRESLLWRARGQGVGAAESFDWGLACLAAGDLEGALRVEAAWLPQQRPDGGFPDGYVPLLGQEIGASSSYAAARFVLFERTLTMATGPAAHIAA